MYVPAFLRGHFNGFFIVDLLKLWRLHSELMINIVSDVSPKVKKLINSKSVKTLCIRVALCIHLYYLCVFTDTKSDTLVYVYL